MSVPYSVTIKVDVIPTRANQFALVLSNYTTNYYNTQINTGQLSNNFLQGVNIYLGPINAGTNQIYYVNSGAFTATSTVLTSTPYSTNITFSENVAGIISIQCGSTIYNFTSPGAGWSTTSARQIFYMIQGSAGQIYQTNTTAVGKTKTLTYTTV
jgi:glutamine cyclotransferase